MKLISDQRGKKLLKLIRKALTHSPSPQTRRKEDLYGVFVTLYINGKERGCAGIPFAEGSLEEMTEELAIYAASEDPRYPSIQKEELGDLSIQLAILSPPKPIRPEEILLGVHGIILTKGENSALHLPQVAVEMGWDIPLLLEKTALKAGLPPDIWKKDGEIFAFQTQRFFADPRTKKSPPNKKTTPPI